MTHVMGVGACKDRLDCTMSGATDICGFPNEERGLSPLLQMVSVNGIKLGMRRAEREPSHRRHFAFSFGLPGRGAYSLPKYGSCLFAGSVGKGGCPLGAFCPDPGICFWIIERW